MLTELRSFTDLGTPNFYYELLKLMEMSSKHWDLKDIHAYFYNKCIDGRTTFSGGIMLAIKMEILIEKKGKFTLNPDFKLQKKSKEELNYKFCEYLFKSLKKDPLFFDIFSSENMLYEVNYKVFAIKSSAFKFRFSSLKQILFDFNILQKHPDNVPFQFILNPQFRKIFDDNVSSAIRNRQISPEELEEYLRLNQEFGEQAEKFVLEFENKRLRHKKKVEWIAAYIVNAGYDIASYDQISDVQHSRLIEVKSYQGANPYFFWSRNEFLVAKQKKKSYWIYLVNRVHINRKDYKPMMIQDPYSSILENEDWTKDVHNYRISLIPNLSHF